MFGGSVQNLEIIEPLHSNLWGTSNKKRSLYNMLKTTKTIGGYEIKCWLVFSFPLVAANLIVYLYIFKLSSKVIFDDVIEYHINESFIPYRTLV